MNASRSVGSTSAPHFVILSTSFVHAALLRRCCTMMRASWHSVQAVVTFACMGPGGNSGLDADCTRTGSQHKANNATTTTLTFDMDRHPINCIVQIAARIPDWSVGLGPSLAIGCARRDRVFARFRSFPLKTPEPPRVARLLRSQLRRLPGSLAIARNFDLHHIRLSGPGNALKIHDSRPSRRTVPRTHNHRLHV